MIFRIDDIIHLFSVSAQCPQISLFTDLPDMTETAESEDPKTCKLTWIWIARQDERARRHSAPNTKYYTLQVIA